MDGSQQNAIFQFALGKICRDALNKALGFDFDEAPHRVHALLDQAERSHNPAEIEAALILAYRSKHKAGLAAILARLLAATWHQKHEDIVLQLQRLRDPSTVAALYDAALVRHEYLQYDSSHALARKCTWALADIGTQEAFNKLEMLAKHSDPIVAGYAQKRLNGWQSEQHRKRK